MNRVRWLPGCLVFAGLMAIYACFFHTRDWNTATRLMLTYSLIQNGSIEITPMVAENGRLLQHPQTRDLSEPRPGHFFCDKAPGQSFLGAISYTILRTFGVVPPHPHAAPAKSLWTADYWVTLFSSGLLTATTGALLVTSLQFLGVNAVRASVVGLAFGLATHALAYATLFYGHSSAGFLTLLSLWILYRRPSLMGQAAAGFVAGLAVLVEYPQVVFPAAVVVVRLAEAIFQRGRGERIGYRNTLRNAGCFIAGGVPVAFALGYYHYLVTGSPLVPPYRYEVEAIFDYHRQGLGIPIGLPRWNVVFELLFGEQRGLVWFAPVVVGALPGTWILYRRGDAPLCLIIWGTFLGLLLINAGHPTWDGGWSTGPRFLLPAVPLLMLPTGVWLGVIQSGWWIWPDRIVKSLWVIAAIASILRNLAFGFVGGRVPYGIPSPLYNFVFESIRRRQQEPNAGDWLLSGLYVQSKTGWPSFTIIVAIAAVICIVVLMIVHATCSRRKQR